MTSGRERLFNGLQEGAHDLAETLFTSKNNYIVTADPETAAALVRNLVATSELSRENHQPTIHRLGDIPGWVRTRVRQPETSFDRPSAMVNLDCLEIQEATKDGLPASHHVIRSMVEQFSALFPQDAPPIDLDIEYSLMDIEKFLSQLKKNVSLDRQTVILRNFNALTEANQMGVATTLLQHLSSRSTINTIIFHDQPINTGLPRDGGYTMNASLENETTLFQDSAETSQVGDNAEKELKGEKLNMQSKHILTKLLNYTPNLTTQSEVGDPHNWVDSRDLRSFMDEEAAKQYDGMPAATAKRFHHGNDKSDPYRWDINLEYFDNIPLTAGQSTPFGRLSLSLKHEKLLTNGTIDIDFRRLVDQYVLDVSLYKGAHQQHIEHYKSRIDQTIPPDTELPPFLAALSEKLANDPANEFLIRGLRQALSTIQ